MKIRRTERFLRSYQDAPVSVKKAFEKQIRYLSEDIRHPSLHAKKYDERLNYWQARVNRDWRFYFQIQQDTYILLDIMAHPK